MSEFLSSGGILIFPAIVLFLLCAIGFYAAFEKLKDGSLFILPLFFAIISFIPLCLGLYLIHLAFCLGIHI